MAVGVARLENRVRELRLVRGVRIMLRFKAERRMLLVDVAVAARGSVEPVAGIELDARFGRFDLHGTAGFRIFRERAEAHFARFLIGKDEAVVVTAAEVFFRNAGDVFADRLRGGEVERGALNGFDFARRNERVVGRQIAFLSTCDTLMPIVKLIKHGIIPLIQLGIPIVLILLGMLDLGKAVVASKEDEIKAAQKLLIKRVVYAVAIFFVVLIVQAVFGLLSSTGDDEIDEEGNNWIGCWETA